MMPHYIFGPVASRRLGRSLGIDLIPFKTCTYNCIYCECGKTTDLSIQRKEFFPVQDIIKELDYVLSQKPKLDYITFAGSGEPTLSLSIGQIISFLKDNYPNFRVAVLTNGSLLSNPDVRTEILNADLIIPTLTTTIQMTFEQIHRPVPNIFVSSVIEGINALRKEFSHHIWLEIFLVPPLNTSECELNALREAIYTIRPDRIQVNTLDRPGTESWVQVPDPETTEMVASFLSEGGIAVDIIGNAINISPLLYPDEISMNIEETLSRRPCTADDIAQITGIHRNEVKKKIRDMVKYGIIQEKRGERGIFYLISRK